MRPGLLAWLLGAALAIAGCEDRHAGTETGNPEITVTAMFFFYEHYNTKTSGLHFRIMGMEYSSARQSGAADTGKCWNRPGGTLTNLADHKSRPLPDTVIEDLGPWQHAEIILRSPDEVAEIPDSIDIETWSSPRYAKFDLFSDEGSRKVLFEMPRGAEYRLRFGTGSTEEWRFRDTMMIPVFFDAWRWTDTLSSIPGLVPRLDGRNAPYLLISPGENASAWDALKARLPNSFYADSVIVR
jgi:hypothetical protein